MDPETPTPKGKRKTPSKKTSTAKKARSPRKAAAAKRTSADANTPAKRKTTRTRKTAAKTTIPRRTGTAARTAGPADRPSGDVAPARRALSAEERHRMIAEAAYYRAERRGFAPGHEVADWADAEAEIDARILGERSSDED